jgi:hypothetical protein
MTRLRSSRTARRCWAGWPRTSPSMAYSNAMRRSTSAVTGDVTAVKHLVTILGRPDDVIAMVKKRVTASGISNSRYTGYCASRRLKPFPA